MKITRTTTITPEFGDTASDLASAIARVGDGATASFVHHTGDRNQSDYITIQFTETLP